MNKIIIDVGIKESRVAIIENDYLAELYVEREDEKKIIGNIYLGKVVNLLKGMEAAFVDIGLKKNAYLSLEDTLVKDIDKDKNIDEVLRTGQSIIVQVIKEPYNDKGARVTTNISLPGRYTVFIPYSSFIGVSKKIEEEEERQRLKDIVNSLIPEGKGCVVRTNSEGVAEEILKRDIEFLITLYEKNIDIKHESSKPHILYKELDVIQRISRDYIDHRTDKIIINDREKYSEMVELVELLYPNFGNKVEFFKDSYNIFNFYGMESMIKNGTDRTVHLNNGGYIVIDEIEAMTSIDVNTGKYIGKSNLEDTIFNMNLEATVEIAKQIRLRNIGGIIIIDFIDMNNEEFQKELLSTLEQELQKDKTKTKVLGLTRLGLVEMTRKKSSSRLTSRLLRKCPYCNGNGKITSEEVIITNIQNEVKKLSNTTEIEAILFEVNPLIKKYIINNKKEFAKNLKDNFNIEVYLCDNKDIFFDEIKIVRMGSKEYMEKYILDRS